MEDQQTQLRRDAVGLPGLIAQSLGVTGPELSAVIIASVAATVIGAGAPLAFVLAGIGALGLAWVYSRLARYAPHAGGTYALIREGLGARAGYFAGWVNMAVGFIFVPALIIASSFLMLNFFSLVAPDAAWLSSTWVGWAVVLGAIVFYLSYRGVEISANVLLTLTAIGVGLLLIFDVIILARGGAEGLAWGAFAPWNQGGVTLGALALAVGIAMTGFSGFETAVFLAEEAKAPTRLVPKAVLGAVVVALVFYVLTTFAIVTGYGISAAGATWPEESAGAVVSLSAQFIALDFGAVLLLVLAVSSLASSLGTLNFTSRIVYAWGREGTLPAMFGRTHRRFQTPHTAVAGVAVVTLAMYVFGWLWQGSGMDAALTLFSWLLLCGATGILPIYSLVGISGFAHAGRTGGSFVDRWLAPLFAVVVTLAAEVTEFYPVQPSPFTYAPYFMVGWMVLGVIVGLVQRSLPAAGGVQATGADVPS